jgi:hydrogenase expression/formation protein HypE
MSEKGDYPIMEGAACPIPLSHHQKIVLGHGSGGRMSHDLIRKLFLHYFNNPALVAGNDAALVTPLQGSQLAISTDAHVVSPLFFPGGDIGRLAVCGTVNDVAMLGAQPLYLTAGFILEEGLEFETLQRVVVSMATAASEAGVSIVAGDTKVVQKGKADGLYITTAGVGVVLPGANIGGANAQPGDAVILSGSIGDHGIAVLAARGELGFDTAVKSDIAPLNHLVYELIKAGIDVHVLRDPTRGGLATSLNEIAQQSQVCIQLDEKQLNVTSAVAAACEMLGFDPLYIANEGKLIAIVSPDHAEQALAIMKAHPLGSEAAIIGSVQPTPSGRVLMKTPMGSTRIVDMLAGELLPRIC